MSLSLKSLPGKVSPALKKASIFLQENSPHILTGLAVVGVITTTVLACKATIKATEIIKEEHPADKAAAVSCCWKTYIPVAISGGLTIAAMIGAHTIDVRKNAALVALYSTAQDAIKEYEKSLEMANIPGKNKDTVKETVASGLLGSHPVDERRIIRTQYGDHLCYDPWIDRYFRASQTAIDRAVNDFNYMMLGDYRGSLNEFYQYLGLDSCEAGDILGFTAQNKLEMSYEYSGASNGEPCIVMKFSPRTDWRWE